MASQNRDIVVNIISDASEFLKGYEQAIAELEKYAKKADIASGMQHQINELKEDIKEMSVALKNIAVNNIDTKQLDDLGKKLELQEYKIKQLQKDKNKIKIQVDELSVKKINDIVGQAENIVDQLIEKVQTLNQLGINIQTESTKNNSDEIKELSAKLNELQLKKEQLSKGNDFSSLNTEEAIAKLKELQKQSTLLYDELGKLGKNTLQRDNKIIEIGQISKDIQVLQNQLKDTGRLKLDDLIDEDFIREDINEAENIISNFITKIKTEISGLTSNTQIDASSLQLKDGKISVKLDIDTTAEKLRQQAKTLIQEVQTEVWKTPLMVPLKFTSSYKTKALEELKVFEDTLHSMSDSQEKTALVSQLDNLKKQLNARDFRIDFKTNIDTLEKNISTGLTNIQTLLKNAKLYVYPEVVIDETSKKKIQDTLNEISKSLNLDINIEKILGEEDRKKIQESLQGIKIELTPNVKLTDKDIENINKKLARQLSKLNIGINTTELQSELSNTFSDTVIEKWGNKFISVIENLSHMFQRVFNVASDTDISNQWSKLQEQFNSFAKDDGNFDARKKEVVELIQEYQKYLDMGGKDPIANLTGNKKGQDKLTAQYNKYRENQKKVAQDSAKAIEEENKALEKTEKVAKKSAQAKEEFAQANQGVKKSAKQSAESIKEEVKEIQNVDNVINDNKNSTSTTPSSSVILPNQQSSAIIVDQIKQEQEIIEETGVVATNTAQLVAQAEDVKQKEYKETANALEVLRKAQVGTADIFQKTQSNFDFTNPHLQAKEWFEAYANSIAQAEGLSESKYTIHTDANQNFKYATIEYYNEALKQTITETWEWHKANQKVAGDTDRMVVSNIKFVDNIKARYTQEKKDTETMSTALRKASEALTSFDSKTQGKLKGNEKYKELSELLSNGFKDLKDVERAQQLMNELNVELNNINADARRGSASFDIFSNMVKGISEADNKVKLLTIDYQSLTNVSDDVTQKFEKLLQSLSALKNAQGVEAQAKAYGNYREALNEATYAIRIFKKEQGLIDKTTISYQRDTLLAEDVNTQKLQLDKLQQSLRLSGLLTDELNLKFEKLYAELDQVDSRYSNNLWKKSFQQLQLEIGSTVAVEKEREHTLRDIISLTEKIANKEAKIKLLDINTDLADIKQLQAEIEILQTKLNDKQTLFGDLNGYFNLDTTTISELAVIWGRIEAAEQKALDKQLFENAKQDYNDLKKILSDIVSVKERLAKATINENSFSIESLTMLLSTLENKASDLQSSLFSNIKGLNILNVDDLKKLNTISDSFSSKLAPLKDKQANNLETLYNQLSKVGLLTDEITQEFLVLYQTLTLVEDNESLANWISQFKQLQNQFPKELIDGLEKIGSKFDLLPSADGKIDLYAIKIREILNNILALRESIVNLNTTDDSLYTDGSLDAEKYNAKIQELIKSITDLNKASIQYNIQNNTGGNKGVLLENTVGMIHNTKDVADALIEYAQTNKLGKEIGIKDDDINQVSIAFKNQDGVITKLTGKIVDFADKSEDAAKAIRLVTDRTSGAIGLFGNFGSVLGKFGKQILIYYFSLHDFIRYFRNGITVVKEFDAAMTELIKVSNDSEKALFAFEKEAFNIAETIGSTGKEIINSAADWEKLGYAIADASELAKNSALYANVGDMDIDTATEHMISTLKAFNIEASESIQVVDKFNEIGNNYAITSEGIGAALERSAASLVAAGNDIDESIALITAGNIISQDAESVGNAIKVLSLRIRGSKSELEEMGEETDGLADSTSKLRNELKALTGVDIMLDDSTYKSTYEIILEISKVWDKLTDVSQATVLEKLAGKTRASVVAGLLQQGETLEEVFYRSQDAEGSALKENQKYLESIQGHLDKLTNKWQEMWTNAINRDTANFFIDLGTKILDVINNIGVFRSTLLGLGGVLAFKAKGGGRAKKAVPLLS